MPSPTRGGSVSVAGSTTSPKTTGSLSVTSGDLLVAWATLEDQTVGVTISDSATNTWTLRQDVNPGGSFTRPRMWTAVANATGSITITFTGGSTKWYTCGCTNWSNAAYSTSAKTNTSGPVAPSLAITTSFDNSALQFIVDDFAAADGASRTYRTVNGNTPSAGGSGEERYDRSSANEASYAAYHPDAGTAGSKTIGLTAPSTQTPSLIVIEIQGTGTAAADAVIRTFNPIPFMR